MGKLAKIIRMEFRLTVANRVFVILTIIGPFLIVAITILPSSGTNTERAPCFSMGCFISS